VIAYSCDSTKHRGQTQNVNIAYHGRR